MNGLIVVTTRITKTKAAAAAAAKTTTIVATKTRFFSITKVLTVAHHYSTSSQSLLNRRNIKTNTGKTNNACDISSNSNNNKTKVINHNKQIIKRMFNSSASTPKPTQTATDKSQNQKYSTNATTKPNRNENIKQSAKLIGEADFVFITAGAGMYTGFVPELI